MTERQSVGGGGPPQGLEPSVTLRPQARKNAGESPGMEGFACSFRLYPCEFAAILYYTVVDSVTKKSGLGTWLSVACLTRARLWVPLSAYLHLRKKATEPPDNTETREWGFGWNWPCSLGAGMSQLTGAADCQGA